MSADTMTRPVTSTITDRDIGNDDEIELLLTDNDKVLARTFVKEFLDVKIEFQVVHDGKARQVRTALDGEILYTVTKPVMVRTGQTVIITVIFEGIAFQ